MSRGSSHSSSSHGSSSSGGSSFDSSSHGKGSGFGVQPEDLDSAGKKLDQHSSALGNISSNIKGLNFGSQTFGVVGQAFAGGAKSHVSETADVMDRASASVGNASTGVRKSADTYRKIDDSNHQDLNKIHFAHGGSAASGTHSAGATNGSANTKSSHNVDSDPPGNPGGAASSSASTTGNAASAPGPTTLSGTDSKGQKVHFSPHDVQSIPLKDGSGNVIGVSFPSKPDDPQKVTKWAGVPNRNSDSSYYKDYDTANKKNKTSAPWTNPFYVHAHANPNNFAVTVGNQKIRVDGATHGKILASNQHFQNASSADPSRPLVYMSCSSGSSSGNAAASSANVVHGSGHSGDVYAPTGTGVRLTAQDGSGSSYGVKHDPAGGDGEFKKF